MAEVLITLAIIGVVAALTIPTLITNYRNRVTATQLKKSYNTITNGFKTMMAQEGVTSLMDTALWAKMSSGGMETGSILTSGNEEAIKEFEKYFRVANIYEGENIPKEYEFEYKQMNGESIGEPFSGYVVLSDGTTFFMGLYKSGEATPPCENNESGPNKACESLKQFQEYYQTSTKLWKAAGYFYIDVNGYKEPNVFGRDLFTFVLGSDGALYPYGSEDYAVIMCRSSNLDSCGEYWKNAKEDCGSQGSGWSCAAHILGEGWEIKY